MKLALALASVLASGVAEAAPAPDATEPASPAVDVADLPPLPAASEEASSSATVLAASAAEEDVVVGAAKREQSLGNVASAVTVVSGDRIRRFGYRTIGEAVAGVAGLYLVDNRLSYSIGIRGLQVPGDFNTRILVLVDGASVNEAWGAFAGVGFDSIVSVDDIARIEVIRGPVSSVYGTNAFFGILNIVTRGASETPRAWVRAAINSINGVTTSVGFASGGVHQQLRGSLQFMNRIGDTTSLPDVGDHLTGDGSQQFAGSLVAASGGSFAQLRAYRYNRESPFAPYDVNPMGPPYNQYDTQLLVEGGHTHELSKRLTVAARVYANLYHFNDSAPPFDPTMGSALATTGTAEVFGAELRGRYELVVPNKVGITAGTELSYDRTLSTAFSEDAPNTLIANVPLNSNLEGLYTEVDTQPTEWLGFTGGLRYDRNSAFDNRLSPRAALFLAKPERYGLKLLYAEGFRNASAFESYFEDGADFEANHAIKAETISSFEAVAWAKPVPGLAVRVSGFYWDARGIIEQQPAPDNPAELQFQNVTRYVTEGVEAEASYRDSRGWYGFGGFTYARVGSAETTGVLTYGYVPNAPAVSASLGISTPKLFGRLHLSTEAILIGERQTRLDGDGNPSPASPAWVGINPTIYIPDVGGFDITAGVRNLIGTRDLMPAPGDYDRTQPATLTVPRVPGEGREVYVKVGYAY